MTEQTPDVCHFAPRGSTNALCDETVPPSIAVTAASGEYADPRFTLWRERVTCRECVHRMTHTYGNAAVIRAAQDEDSICCQCQGPLTEARAGLGLTLCSGACHRAARTEARLHAANNTIRDLTLEVARLDGHGHRLADWGDRMEAERDTARADLTIARDQWHHYAEVARSLRDDLSRVEDERDGWRTEADAARADLATQQRPGREQIETLRQQIDQAASMVATTPGLNRQAYDALQWASRVIRGLDDAVLALLDAPR